MNWLWNKSERVCEKILTTLRKRWRRNTLGDHSHSSLGKDHCGMIAFYFSTFLYLFWGLVGKDDSWASIFLVGVVWECARQIPAERNSANAERSEVGLLVMPCLPTHVSLQQLSDGSLGWGFLSPRLGNVSELQKIGVKQPEVSCLWGHVSLRWTSLSLLLS